MLTKILNWLGFVRIDYGYSCGRHWVQIGDKMIAQTPGDDLWMKDEDVRRLAMAVAPDCIWLNTPWQGDEWFVQEVKQRWPWHDHEAMLKARGFR